MEAGLVPVRFTPSTAMFTLLGVAAKPVPVTVTVVPTPPEGGLLMTILERTSNGCELAPKDGLEI